MCEADLTDEEIQQVAALMRLGGWHWNRPGPRTVEFIRDVKGLEWVRLWKRHTLTERMPTYRRLWAYFPSEPIPGSATPDENLRREG